MDIQQFIESLALEKPPANLPSLLQAMWFDASGNWGKAHEIAQEDGSAEGSHVHAYLHRKEGDISNADYWYLRAGSKRPSVSLKQEWREISERLLTELR